MLTFLLAMLATAGVLILPGWAGMNHVQNRKHVKAIDAPYKALVDQGILQPKVVRQALSSPQKTQLALETSRTEPDLLSQAGHQSEVVRIQTQSSRLPADASKVIIATLNTIEETLEQTMTVEQKHVIQTVLFSHLPDIIQLFNRLPEAERNDPTQLASLMEQLSKLETAVTHVQEELTALAKKQWETNKLYLDSKFGTPLEAAALSPIDEAKDNSVN